MLQRRSSDAVAAQHRCIPKCEIKTSVVIITASLLRRCSCAASVCPKISFFLGTWWKVSLTDFFGLQKQTLPLVGWEKNISSSTIVIFERQPTLYNKIHTLIFGRWEILQTQQVGTVSKCAKDAENVFAPLMMVSFMGALKRTLAGKTFHQTESIDTSFDPA